MEKGYLLLTGNYLSDGSPMNQITCHIFRGIPFTRIFFNDPELLCAFSEFWDKWKVSHNSYPLTLTLLRNKIACVKINTLFLINLNQGN